MKQISINKTLGKKGGEILEQEKWVEPIRSLLASLRPGLETRRIEVDEDCVPNVEALAYFNHVISM